MRPSIHWHVSMSVSFPGCAGSKVRFKYISVTIHHGEVYFRRRLDGQIRMPPRCVYFGRIEVAGNA